MNRGRFLRDDLLICCVGANFNLIRPGDLAELTDVNLPENGGIAQRGKYALPHVRRQIHYPIYPVWIRDP